MAPWPIAAVVIIVGLLALFDDYFAGAVEATEAVVVSALLAAPEVSGRPGRTSLALPVDDVHHAVGE